MELAETKVLALLVAILAEQPHDLPLAGDVSDLLGGTGRRACRFAFSGFAIESARFHEIVHRLFERPAAGMQVDVDADARGPISRQAQHLSLRCGVNRIETSAHQ